MIQKEEKIEAVQITTNKTALYAEKEIYLPVNFSLMPKGPVYKGLEVPRIARTDKSIPVQVSEKSEV